MKHVNKSVLLWYSAEEMHALVTDVPSYPKFLPWCERAEVIEEQPGAMTARLHLSYHGVRQAFTTRNQAQGVESVSVSLVDGPFSQLEGVWSFVPLAAPASSPTGEARACRVELDLRYAFSSRALEAVVSPVFDRIANTLVDSFVKRAEQVYGAR
jgi:ribosome-associated toxin RatA of RatAB toxin-antitoxin module